MAHIIALLGIPLATALLAAAVKNHIGLRLVVWLGGGGTLAAAVLAAAAWFNGASFDLAALGWLKPAVLAAECLLAGYVVFVGIRGKAWFAAVFAGAQAALAVWFELTHEGGGRAAVYVDRLSVLMILIVGIIGVLIAIYAMGYMHDYHELHREQENRRGRFMALLFAFMAAMFGLVICNDMSLMLFCWEATSLCSFLLIGYTKTAEATKNAFAALTANVFGGLAFGVGVVFFGVFFHVTELTELKTLAGEGGPLLAVAALLLATAGMTKSAQMPFSGWLLGAMVAPTPSSALLHSSTMVKAGVYLIIRIAPLLGGGPAGITVTAMGGLTFFITAVMAVTQSDAKKILAYSTISNLGLIVACAGINTPESLWASVMLIVFHAIAKSLLFLAVGTAEHKLGSRDVEAMDGLYHISREITVCLVIGIAGMFIAPFGMLISKWAAMKAFIDSGNILTVMLVSYGGAITLFFWTKWLGKLIANAQNHSFREKYRLHFTEKTALYPLAALVVLVCFAHPLVSSVFVVPYLGGGDSAVAIVPLNGFDSSVIIIMLCALFLLPAAMFPYYRAHVPRTTSVYMSGQNTGDNASFFGGFGEPTRLELQNWYMRGFLRVGRWGGVSYIICAGVLAAGFFAAIGGFALWS